MKDKEHVVEIKDPPLACSPEKDELVYYCRAKQAGKVKEQMERIARLNPSKITIIEADKRIAELTAESIRYRKRAREAEKKVAELEAQLRWIPVSEGLPEETKHVEVISKDNEKAIGWQYKGKWRCILKWDEDEIFRSFGSNNITHWKPITLPAKEKSE